VSALFVGSRPRSQARKYVYSVLSLMLEQELNPDEKEGWVFGGIDDERDRMLLKKAVKMLIREFEKKGEP